LQAFVCCIQILASTNSAKISAHVSAQEITPSRIWCLTRQSSICAAVCRDPLLALGCRDPVERIDAVKSDDPHRRQIVELFDAWHLHHGERPVKASALPEPVRALVDPQGRGRQYVAVRLRQLAGTRAGGFVLTRQEAAGKWGAATY
jgi:hypothetical protein